MTFHKGMRLRTRREMSVRGVITFGAPCSGGFEGSIPAGEILIVDQDPPAFAKGVYLVPGRYKDFERLFVPESDRADPAYSGYAISCSFESVSSDLETI